MPIIEIKKVTKQYGDFKAVNNISFNVKSGETFGILGPNGAGKTTTLEMIEGLRSISKGDILVDKINVKNHPDRVKKIIGVQLQSSNYFDRLTLKELINLFASFYNLKVNALSLLKQVGLESKQNSFVNKLSGGQQQRFSLASTLVNNPKVVFLDEPTTGLDPQARHNVWDMVQDIRGKGQTIVITTHYMEEAEKLCDRIAIMDQGKIIDLDTPKGLINKHGSGSIITFRSQKPLSKSELNAISEQKDVKIEEDRYRLIAKDESKALKQLVSLDKTHNIAEISITPSTLEDVFINLTGKKLRE